MSRRAIDLDCMNKGERSDLRKKGYVVDGAQSLWLAYNLSADAHVSPKEYCYNDTGICIRSQCTFQFTQIPAIGDYSGREFLNDQSSKSGAVRQVGPVAIGSSVGRSLYLDSKMSFDTFRDAFKRVIDSMSMFERASATQLDTTTFPTVGEVWIGSTCVHVRWLWLIYPAVLIVLLLGFFTAVVWRVRLSGQLGTLGYKTLLMPLMFHGLERQNEVLLVEGMEEIDRQAERLNVNLQMTEKGWWFKEE